MFHHKTRNAIGLVLTLTALAFLPLANSLLGFDGQAKDKATATQPKKDVVDPQVIRDLIKQLGDDSFSKREDADKRLAAIGAPALEMLRDASKQNPDLEIRQRAADLVATIGMSLLTQVRKFEGHIAVKSPYVPRVAVTPDGRRIVSSGDEGLRLWNPETGELLLRFGSTKGTIHYMAFSITPDGKRVVAGCNDKLIRVFDLQTGKQVQEFVGHTSAVWGIALSGDGKKLVSGSWTTTPACLWDMETGKKIRTLDGIKGNIRCTAFSPDGKYAAAGDCLKANGQAVVRLWEVGGDKEGRTLVAPAQEITSLTFSPDSKSILASSHDRRIYLWDVESGRELMRFMNPSHRITHAAFTPDGKRVVSCSEFDPTIRIYDVASGKQLMASETVPLGFMTVAVFPDGERCVTAGRDGIVRLWEWKN